ncbi:trans-aconitate methyltransferase [Pseudonocardia eucalypti]|uniref:methyltransferase n=1 Tax=Pseudonocardia eucalypti TaxID=648755 RepID=UPI0016190E36|nr:trans-aconitate methyltransferase [Pseudonocardia eucalypti]
MCKPFTDSLKRAAIECCDFADASQVVDIGCGDGLVLAQLLARWPHLAGVAFDRPDRISGAESKLAEWQLGERLRLVAGDVLASVPSGADTYLLSGALRGRDDAEAVRILSNVRAAAAPGARVMAMEMPDERTDREFRDLFERAGLRYERALGTAAPVSVLMATQAEG